ncbi:MAG: hypothetical protein ACYSWP_17800 [Planctomycetota bacterium]|jgi:hypothetical protein
MNPVIRQIAQRHVQGCKVGEEPLPKQEPGWFSIDPPWARLKRMYVLKDNFYDLYKESEWYAKDPLKTEIKQAYAAFKVWMKQYRTWSDVQFGKFPEELYQQTRIYQQKRQKMVQLLNEMQYPSETIPARIIAKTPPAQLQNILSGLKPGLDTKLMVVGLVAFWIWLSTRKGGNNV